MEPSRKDIQTGNGCLLWVMIIAIAVCVYMFFYSINKSGTYEDTSTATKGDLLRIYHTIDTLNMRIDSLKRQQTFQYRRNGTNFLQ